jgi:hypothetical protein
MTCRPAVYSSLNWSLALRKDQTMKRKKHTEERIIAILKEHEAGMKTADLRRQNGVSDWLLANSPGSFTKRGELLVEIGSVKDCGDRFLWE